MGSVLPPGLFPGLVHAAMWLLLPCASELPGLALASMHDNNVDLMAYALAVGKSFLCAVFLLQLGQWCLAVDVGSV